MTPPEAVRLNPKADRTLLLYGYLRGAPLRQGARLHLAGVGDFDLTVSHHARRATQHVPPLAAAAAAAVPSHGDSLTPLLLCLLLRPCTGG